MDELAEWEAGEFVAVMYENHWDPGRVASVEDSGRVYVKCMEYLEEESWTNKFVWPGKKDEDWYEKEDLILKLDPPQDMAVRGGSSTHLVRRTILVLLIYSV